MAAHGWDDTGITLEQTGVPGDSVINVGGRDAAWGPQPGILILECRQQNLGSRQGREVAGDTWECVLGCLLRSRFLEMRFSCDQGTACAAWDFVGF